MTGTGTQATAAMTIRLVGGPTAILNIGGVRLLTDPTFSPPGRYRSESGSVLVKTDLPAIDVAAVGPVDAVLLSHDQHPDNLDDAGRALLPLVPRVLSTPAARSRIGDPVQALAPWAATTLSRPGGGVLHVTAVPAQHGPDGCEPVVGEVTGFVVTGDGLPTVYVSGDNASLAVVRDVADRFGPVDVALLFAGAARTAVFDGAPLTLTSPDAAEAARILGARHVVPVHFEGWAHFSEGFGTLRHAFTEAGLADRLHLLRPGQQVTVGTAAGAVVAGAAIQRADYRIGVDAANRVHEAATAGAAGARAALESFYHALNQRDTAALGQVWAAHPLARLDNPLGGILDGGPAITDLYAKIFGGPVRVRVGFGDIIEYLDGTHAVFSGRETGHYTTADGREVPLAIRTTRYFRYHDGRWRQYHHHGSVDEPESLRAYQQAVTGW